MTEFRDANGQPITERATVMYVESGQVRIDTVVSMIHDDGTPVVFCKSGEDYPPDLLTVLMEGPET